MLLENQKEQLVLLRQIATSTQKENAEIVEDVLSQRISSPQELDDLNEKLAASDFRKQMVMRLILVVILAQLAEPFISAGENAVCQCVCLNINQHGRSYHRALGARALPSAA